MKTLSQDRRAFKKLNAEMKIAQISTFARLEAKK